MKSWCAYIHSGSLKHYEVIDSREVQTWTNQNIAQTTKSNTWCGADRWAEGRCALCLPHLPAPVTQPSDDRPREPLPFSAAPDEIKGDEQTETESHTQQILPHSLQQQQKPSDRVWRLNSATTVWSRRSTVEDLWVKCVAQRHLSDGRQRNKLHLNLFLPRFNLLYP